MTAWILSRLVMVAAIGMVLAVQAVAQGSANPSAANPRGAVSKPTRVILVSLEDRKLALIEDGQVKKVYSIAVGKPSTPSPVGTFTIERRVANLKTIIARFSDFSKMPKPELERIDAREAIERVRSLYETAGQGLVADNASAKIRFDLQLSAQPMPLDADPELLHRALSNLVLNAMDAMPEGGVLTLSAQPKGETVELRVADTGQGMTPEECERLFTPYYTTKEHGTGLGLAIVQSVIADHGGAIAVESRTGGGTAFVITLPKASETKS